MDMIKGYQEVIVTYPFSLFAIIFYKFLSGRKYLINSLAYFSFFFFFRSFFLIVLSSDAEVEEVLVKCLITNYPN